jgi:hypothetical protein
VSGLAGVGTHPGFLRRLGRLRVRSANAECSYEDSYENPSHHHGLRIQRLSCVPH